MKIEIDLPDDTISIAIREAIRRGDSSWRRGLEIKAQATIELALKDLDLKEPIKEYLAQLTNEVLEDQVRARLRYVVKLAVDNELATARMAEQIRAAQVREG